ncbi:hypothetical protein [Starkeya sp. ORNL1]|uniref:hypothetical protein n=1 Tax=Starkeya sp. ORNL1 TaxID=2709380 RepID=UPI001FEDB73F|nr:hypothetical protein [Starkeya sp. ORNL1]
MPRPLHLPSTAAALAFALIGLCMPANAQPTQAQQSAIRSACPSDFRANCSGVQPGGQAALTCLQQNMAKLSPACQSAVGAIGGGATAAPATTTAPVTTTAPASSPDAGASTAPATAPVAAPTTTPAKPSTAAKPPAAAKPSPSTKPTQAQQSAIRSACQSDFRANCAGVQPGGSAALACLQQNMAGLSASCQKAVGAVGGGAAAAPAGTAPPAAAQPATMARPPVALTPRQEIMIVRQTCGPDFRRLCSTVPLGGGRGIACLRANAASLSPGCQSALMGR